MKKIIIINGPNLNLLGKREPNLYGQSTWKNVENQLKSLALKHLCETDFFQSNHEGKIIDYLHTVFATYQKELTKPNYDKKTETNIGVGIIINAGALTHTSIGIRDALSMISPKIPFVEVHVSNVYQREDFRKHSFLSDIAQGVIVGCGTKGYILALQYLLES